MNTVDFHGTFWFPAAPAQLWAAAEQFGLFESWWGWLADFHADTPGLVAGNVLHGLVVPPVPCQLRLLEMRSPPLRAAARVAYPLMRWGHDRVVDMAVAGFRQRALPSASGGLL